MNLLNMSTQKHDTRQTLLYTTKHQKKAALIADRDGDQVSIMILDSKVQGVGDDDPSAPRFDIMADLTFGESMSLLETQDYNPWLQGIFDQIFYACVSRTFQYLPLLWSVVQRLIARSVHELAEASVKFSADRVDKRLKMDIERPDIFGLVLKHEAGSKMPRHEMHANADLLMTAGTETTATMLSDLTFNLLTNPGAMSRLTREIRGTFESGSDINADALARLPVGVSVPHFAAYRSSYNFIESDRFLPERWLAPGIEGYDSNFSSDKKGVLQPFSTGPRNCLGMNLAYHEMRLIISHLLWNFDVELSDRTSKDWLDQTTHVVWDKKPFFVHLSPRKDM
ncbi:hypothetical protein Q7P35_003240 [Cladosporium inversicolor]